MMPSEPPPSNETDVRSLASDPRLEVSLRLVTGEGGLNRPVRHPRVQKSGLALAGHFMGVVPTRVQVLGETELSFLRSLDGPARDTAVRGFLGLGLSCIVLTGDKAPPPALTAACHATATPLYVSNGKSSRTINAIHEVLDARLAPTTEIHGVLVDVFGVGLLLLGKSGIGKSECAIELIMRGHRLVADDIVHCEYRPPGMVFGSPKGILKNHIEVRGLGILNVESMFGVTAVRDRKRINVVTRLEEWNDATEYDRLGVADEHMPILGTPLRALTIPVRPARDMGAILELVAREELLRRGGRYSAREFLERVGITKSEPAGDARRAASTTSQPPASHAVATPPPRIPPLRPMPGTRPMLSPHERLELSRTESSAYIPAVKSSSTATGGEHGGNDEDE